MMPAFPVTFRRGLTVALSAALLLLGGCASVSQSRDSLGPILPSAQTPRAAAPPAAYDAMHDGLSWIEVDAPRTRVDETPSGGWIPDDSRSMK